MKQITLPNGRVAHFPDATKPEVIASAVAKLMAQEKPTDNTAGSQYLKSHQEAVKRGDEDRQERKASEVRQEAAHQGRHQKTLAAMDKQTKSMDAHTKATTSVAQGVNGGLDALVKGMKANAIILAQLGQKVDSLAKAGDDIKQLAKCVDGLQAQIKNSTDMLIKVMKSPRKVVHSAKGRPIGVQIGDE